MPTKNPTPEQRAEWEAGRQRKRLSLSVAPETVATLERVAEAEDVSLSRAADLVAEAYEQNAKTPAQP